MTYMHKAEAIYAGTGVWTVEESSLRHIAAPTIATAHYLRLLSANRSERKVTQKLLKIPATTRHPEHENREKWIETIRLATYAAFLCSFIQGLNVCG
jgi:6-phosphogluconate dehydrogenase